MSRAAVVEQLESRQLLSVNSTVATIGATSETINVSPSSLVPTTTAVSTSGASVLTGQSETLTATVSSSSGTVNAGTVQFYDGSTALGNPANVINGTAIDSTSTLPIGVNLITAVYSGDGGSFAGSSTILSPSSVIQTVAGNGKLGYKGDNGPATSAELALPSGIAIDPAGDLFIADYYNEVIREVNATTHVITTVAGNGTVGNSGDNGPATSAELHDPLGVAVDSAGDLFIADSNNYEIREVHATTHVITTFAGNGTFGYSGDNGPATSAELGNPTRLAIDSAGDLFITDSAKSVVREVNATTHVITTVAGNGLQGDSGDNGPATSADLLPNGIAIDSAGDLFIADLTDSVVREVNAMTHVITTVAGNGTAGHSGDNGPATSAELNTPEGVAIDSAGDLFIADAHSYTIREVNATTHVITTVAGNGTVGYSGDNGAAISANLNSPGAVAFDSAGDMIIDDLGNCAIREVFSGASTVTVTVTQPPVSSGTTIPTALTVLQNAATTSLGLTGVAFTNGGGSDQSSETLTYAVTALPTSSFGTVYLSDGTTAVTIGTYTLAQIDGMEFKPALNANNTDASGPQPFTFTVDNGGPLTGGGVNTLTETMSIGITPVTQPPVLTAGTIAPLAVLQNAVITSLGLTGVTFGPGGGSDQSSEVLTYAVTTVPSSTFGTVYLSDGTTAVTTGAYTLAQIDGMEFKPAINANNADASGPQSFEFTVDNGGSSSNGGVNTITETVSIGITPVTQPPVLTAGTIAPLTVLQNATTTSLGLTGVTFGPGGGVDQANDVLTYAVTTVPSSTFGTVYLSDGTTAVTTGAYTLAQIDGMEFKPALGSGNIGASSPQSFTFSVNNGGVTSNGGVNTLTETVSIGMFTLSGLPASQTYTKGSAPVAIAPNLAIADSAGVHITAATITITNWNTNEDRLSFYNGAALAHSLVVNTATNTATLTLSGTALAGAYQTELQSLMYQDVNLNSPVLTARNVTITLSSNSSFSTSASTSISVQNVNLPPVLSGIETTPLAYTANGAPEAISATLLAFDDDTTNLTSATVKISSGYQNNTGGNDVLSFVNQNGISGSFDATMGTLTLTGNVAVGYYRQALRSVTFGSSGSAVSAASRTLTITVTDTNDVSSTPITRNVSVTVPPTLSGISSVQTFVKGSPPMPISGSLSLSDAAGVTVSSATVSITNWNSNEDRMTFYNGAGLAHTFNVNSATNTAILTLTGNASVAAYQTELQSLMYQDVNLNSPVLTARNVTIAFTDSASNDGSVVTSISVQNVNLPPVLSGIETTPLAYTANGAPEAISATLLAFDDDTTNLTFATVKISSGYQNNTGGNDVLSFVNQNGISGSFDATMGTLTLTGNVAVGYYRQALRSVTFGSSGTAVSAASRTLTITATDTNDVSSTPITRNVSVSVPPMLSGISSVQTFVKGSPPMPISGSLLLSDAAGVTVSSATVSITNWNSNEDRMTFYNGAGLAHTFNVNSATNTAILTLTGNASVAAYQTELQSLMYQDVNLNSPVLTARNVTIAFTDSASNDGSVVTSISVQNVNLPPVLSGIETTPLAYTANRAPKAISATLLAFDDDTTNLTSATVKISSGYQNNTGGHDVLSFVNQNGISGSFDAKTGTLTLTGNVAVGYYRQALRSVKFGSSGTAVSTASRTLTITVTDTNDVSSTPITRNVSVSP